MIPSYMILSQQNGILRVKTPGGNLNLLGDYWGQRKFSMQVAGMADSSSGCERTDSKEII